MHIAATTYDEAPLSTTANPGFLRMSALRGDCSRLRLKNCGRRLRGGHRLGQSHVSKRYFLYRLDFSLADLRWSP